MALNVFRFDPPCLVPEIKKVFETTPALKENKNKNEFIEFVTQMQKLPAISIDDAANEAVRANNEE